MRRLFFVLTLAATFILSAQTRKDQKEIFDSMALTQEQQQENTVKESHVKEISSMSELQSEISRAKGVIFLDCYSPGCPPCRMLSPKFDQFSKDFSSRGTFLKANLNTIPELIDQYQIKSIPTLIVFRDKKEVERRTSLYAIIEYFEGLN